MGQQFFLSNILLYTILILILGTLFSYIIYFFTYKNQIQNILMHDGIYNLIKLFLLLTLSVSFVFFILFLYFFYNYYIFLSNYSVFNQYTITPIIMKNSFFFFEFSVDVFGIFLLLLAYFVGIFSLLALDNRFF